MFIIKYFQENSSNYDAYEADHYRVEYQEEGCHIACFDDSDFNRDDECALVASKQVVFVKLGETAVIENSRGKTIDTIRSVFIGESVGG